MDRSDFIVYLDQIPQEGLKRDLEISDAESAKLHLAVRQSGPFTAGLTLSRHGARVLVRGEVDLAASLECSRCLRTFTSQLHNEMETYLEERQETEGEEDMELAAEKAGIQPLEKGTVDLREMVAELVHLALPVKPLCSQDCKGLCSRCGVDLNSQSCSCAGERFDPRWEALQKLKNVDSD